MTNYDKVHGSVYNLKNGWYEAFVFNVLDAMANGLDGHYIIIFKMDGTFKIFKHGDYSNSNVLNSLEICEFKGFINNLTEHAKKYIGEVVKNTIESMVNYPNNGKSKGSGKIWVFDKNFFETIEIIPYKKYERIECKPIYFDYL